MQQLEQGRGCVLERGQGCVLGQVAHEGQVKNGGFLDPFYGRTDWTNTVESGDGGDAQGTRLGGRVSHKAPNEFLDFGPISPPLGWVPLFGGEGGGGGQKSGWPIAASVHQFRPGSH